MVRMGDGDTSEVDGVSGSEAAAAMAATSAEAVSARSFFPVTVSLHYYELVGSEGGNGGDGDDDVDGNSEGDGRNDDDGGGGVGDGRSTTGHTHRGRAIGRCGGAR